MLNIGVAGLGTVGCGVVRLFRQNAGLIMARAGMPIGVRAVCASDSAKKRDCDLTGIEWVSDVNQLARMPGIDVVVELIGGTNGSAKELAETALKNNKHFVTANKALMASHGVELAKLAEVNKRQLAFEAAVAGGIPVIKTLREGMAGNQFTSIRGILNGTSNYILTRMFEGKLSFDDALQEAQRKGYAESNPSADIDGHDTASKLALLAALAFGCEPDIASVQTEGIRRIRPVDLDYANELGYQIKLLGIARVTSAGLEQRVSPSLVARDSALAEVDGVLNAIMLQGDFSGDLMLEGQGAGAEPTASAVVADLIDIARRHIVPAFGVPAANLKKLPSVKAGHHGPYYMRLQVADKPGVVADVSAILKEEAISIGSLLQRARSDTEAIPVVITTHDTKPEVITRAAQKIAKVATVREMPCLLPIED